MKDESLNWQGTYIGSNPYDFLIWQDFDSPGGVLDAQGAVEFFLQKRNIACKSSSTYMDFYKLLRDCQPKWLDVDTKYLKDHVICDANDRTGNDLKIWLKARLAELFRFNEKPPDWIQNPEWPITENGPMFFLGQVDLPNCELFHDVAAVYVFIDRVSGTAKNVIQVS